MTGARNEGRWCIGHAVRVSSHAISRAIERGAAANYDEAMARLTTPTFARAVALGANAVVMPTGHRAVIEDGCVVTVHPKRAKHRRKREIEE
jgi:O6-methylguanine-DNA--protein-cysteine methyltransferase